MNILFITDEYIPHPSSNGACVAKLVNAIGKENNAYVLSITKNNIENTSNITYAFYKRKPASIKNRLIGYCQDDGFVKAICDNALKIIDEKSIDKVVCLCRPAEPIIAGIYLKKRRPNISIVGYFLDNLFEHSIGGMKEKIIFFNYKRLFKRFYKFADKLIVLKYYRKTFSKLFKKQNKICYVGLPSLVKPQNKIIDNNKPIKIVYTGSVNKSYRNPANVLEILAKIIDMQYDLQIDFFSMGCEDLLSEFKSKADERINISDKVPFEYAQKQIAEASVLLNISNDLPYAVPGKLFEYFSTGKPILNYSFREDDPSNEECEKYANIFTLYSYKENDISKCIEFLISKKEPIAFDTLETRFFDSTPKFTIEKILKN